MVRVPSPEFRVERIATYMVAMMLVGVAVAQDDNGAEQLDRARSAFRDAIERVMIPTSRLTDGPQVRAAFRDAIGDARRATVEVLSDGKQMAIGGVVGSDGWVLTKASQLDGALICRFDDGREFDARLVGVDRAYDLAMLKIEAKDLPVLGLKRDDDASVGEWVATVGLGRDPIAVGVVSVDTRSIRHQQGWLGVGLDQVEAGPRITQVYPESGAAAAGVLVNDIVLAVNEEATPTREKMIRTVRQFSPGDVIELQVQRDDQKLTLRVVLTARVAGMPDDRRDFQNRLGSELSERRFGFPQAFQHDTVLKADACGGPLVDLEGQVVGFNIARSGRTESYAIPAQVALTRFYDLMSGNLKPEEEAIEAAEEAAEEPADEDAEEASDKDGES